MPRFLMHDNANGNLTVGNFVYLTRWRSQLMSAFSWSMFAPVETGANNAQLRQTTPSSEVNKFSYS